MNTKRILAMLAAGLFAVSTLSAAEYDECSDKRAHSFFDCATVGVDLLYWSAYTPSLQYVRVNTPSSNSYESDYQNIASRSLKHQWDPAFRIHGVADNVWRGWDLSLSYTRYASGDHRSCEPKEGQTLELVYNIPAFISFSEESPSKVSAKSRIQYQTVDLLVGQQFDCFGPCQTLETFLGIEGLILDQKKEITALTSELSDKINWKSQYKGLGAKIGTEYAWMFCPATKWFARGSFSMLAGKREDQNTQMHGEQKRIIQDHSVLCSPGMHLSTGFDYATSYCGWDLGLRIGYEFVNWWTIPVQRKYTSLDQYQYTTPSSGGILVLHGLFAGAYLTF